MIRVRAVLTGRVAPLGPRHVPSGIGKQPRNGPVRLHRDGFANDEQGDRRHHGGPEKAVHHCPFDHYAAWRERLPQAAARLAAPGAFGENISTLGMTEAEVCIGDVYRLGGARVQVSQGRQPCWRLNERFGEPDMARLVQESRRTGWYYRGLEEGEVGPGDDVVLIDRPAPMWTLDHVMNVLYRDLLNLARLTALAELTELSESWRTLARRRLERMSVEDWSARLCTPPEVAP